MTALIAAIFIASLMGSLHCAGMCGAFLAFALQGGAAPGGAAPGGTAPGGTALQSGVLAHSSARASLHAAYHAGRLLTYTALGAAAGALGAALDLGGSLVGLQRAAAILAGIMMVAFGLIAILRIRGVRLPRAPIPAPMRSLLMKGHRAAFDMPPLRRALFIGLLTTLLPCGWLYAFVITAAGTGHPATGALAMAVFWLGTLPVMIALGTGLQALTGILRRHVPVATSLAIVGVGLFTVIDRLAIPVSAAAPIYATPESPETAAERLQNLDHDDLPCCSEEP